MKDQDKREYDKIYKAAKAQGEPFYPNAIIKDAEHQFSYRKNRGRVLLPEETLDKFLDLGLLPLRKK